MLRQELVYFLFLIALPAVLSPAQPRSASIGGTTPDRTSAIIQGASAGLTNQSTGQTKGIEREKVTGERLTDPIYSELRNILPGKQGASVTHFELRRDAALFSFNNGRFYFLPSVMGRVIGAIFLGEGVFQMQPPIETERNFLKHFTGGGEIREPFTQAILYFTDDTYDELYKQLRIAEAQVPRNVVERFKDHQQTLRRELKQTIELRILADLYNPTRPGFFTAYIKGKNHPKLVYGVDPLGFAPSLPSPEEVGLASFDEDTQGIWSLFHRQHEYETAQASSDEDHREYDIRSYKIKAVINRSERLTVTAEVTFAPRMSGLRVLRFALYPKLRVSRVVDEKRSPLPFIQAAWEEGGAFAVVMPRALAADQQQTLIIEYSGTEAIRESGAGNYILVPDARSTWYPNNWQMDFGDRATFDITFQVPRGHIIVGTGKLVSSGQEGDYEVSRWVTDLPTVVAGFNYGQFKVRQRDDEGFKLEVYTNTSEPAEIRQIQILAEQLQRRGVPIAVPLGNLTTSGLAESSLIEALNSVRIYNQYFGANPYGRVAISQQPAASFGQSWPMLVYLPYTAFLDGTQRRVLGLPFRFSEFTDVVGPHEVAHQWWGHLVGWKTYHDQWVSEGFSDFSASLYLQFAYHEDPGKRLKRFLDFWRGERELITEKALLGVQRAHIEPNGVGPIWLGVRLNSGQTSGAYERLVYAKGAFVLHMLRMMMRNPNAPIGIGDDRFIAMTRDFTSTFAHKAASTEDFKRIVEKHITPEMDLDGNGRLDWFFNQWVYGTEIPHYKLEYKMTPDAAGKHSLWLKVTQSKVSDNFKMLVPIYLDYGKGRVVRLGVATLVGNNSAQQEIKLAELPERVSLAALEDVLCTKQETKLK